MSDFEYEAMKGKVKVEDNESNTLYDFDEMDNSPAFISKRFSKLKFKRFSNLSKQGSQYIKDNHKNKNYIDKSIFKCLTMVWMVTF